MLECDMGEQVPGKIELATIAGRLREAREKAGLSAYALAKLSGMSDTAIYLIEAGSRMPSVDTASRLAHALGMTISELLGEVSQPAQSPTPDVWARLAARLRPMGLSAEDAERLLEDAEGIAARKALRKKRKPITGIAGDEQEPPDDQEYPGPKRAEARLIAEQPATYHAAQPRIMGDVPPDKARRRA